MPLILTKTFINVERVADSLGAFVSIVDCIYGTEFGAPEADRLAADGDPSLGEQIFDIPVTQVEPVVQPDGVAEMISGGNRWRLYVFIAMIIEYGGLTCQYRRQCCQPCDEIYGVNCHLGCPIPVRRLQGIDDLAGTTEG